MVPTRPTYRSQQCCCGTTSQATARRPSKRCSLDLGTATPAHDDVGRYRRTFPHHFRSFVDELERCPRLDWIDLQHANVGGGVDGGQSDADAGGRPGGSELFRVDPALRPHADDLDRLFGMVLPNHPSLKSISIRESHIQPRCLQLFADAVPGNPSLDMTMLAFESTPLTVECWRLLKAALGHNVRLEELRLWYCGLDAEGMRLVCEGAGASKHLEALNFRDDVTVPAAAAAPAVAPASQLSPLIVLGRAWPREAFAELVAALRVSTALTLAYLGQEGEFPDAHLVPDLLRTYNFALPSIRLDPAWPGPNVSRRHACQDEGPSSMPSRMWARSASCCFATSASDVSLTSSRPPPAAFHVGPCCGRFCCRRSALSPPCCSGSCGRGTSTSLRVTWRTRPTQTSVLTTNCSCRIPEHGATGHSLARSQPRIHCFRRLLPPHCCSAVPRPTDVATESTRARFLGQFGSHAQALANDLGQDRAARVALDVKTLASGPTERRTTTHPARLPPKTQRVPKGNAALASG
jgi:hypothetical protein